jgi:hypothetical protein
VELYLCSPHVPSWHTSNELLIGTIPKIIYSIKELPKYTTPASLNLVTLEIH